MRWICQNTGFQVGLYLPSDQSIYVSKEDIDNCCHKLQIFLLDIQLFGLPLHSSGRGGVLASIKKFSIGVVRPGTSWPANLNECSSGSWDFSGLIIRAYIRGWRNTSVPIWCLYWWILWLGTREDNITENLSGTITEWTLVGLPAKDRKVVYPFEEMQNKTAVPWMNIFNMDIQCPTLWES